MHLTHIWWSFVALGACGAWKLTLSMFLIDGSGDRDCLMMGLDGDNAPADTTAELHTDKEKDALDVGILSQLMEVFVVANDLRHGRS